MLERTQLLAQGAAPTPEDDILHDPNEHTADMFAGIIGPSENLNRVFGKLTDKYGSSTVYNLTMTENNVAFDKMYDDRPHVIPYLLKKNDDHWIGKYSGNPSGGVKCIITPLPADFLNPPK